MFVADLFFLYEIKFQKRRASEGKQSFKSLKRNEWMLMFLVDSRLRKNSFTRTLLLYLVFNLNDFSVVAPSMKKLWKFTAISKLHAISKEMSFYLLHYIFTIFVKQGRLAIVWQTDASLNPGRSREILFVFHLCIDNNINTYLDIENGATCPSKYRSHGKTCNTDAKD